MASSVAETLRKAGQSLGRVLVIGGGEAAGKERFERPLFELRRAGLQCISVNTTAPRPWAEPETVDKIAEVGRRAGVQLVVAAGGGTVIDTAKAVAAVVPMRRSCTAWLQQNGAAASAESAATMPLPLLAVPTTLFGAVAAGSPRCHMHVPDEGLLTAPLWRPGDGSGKACGTTEATMRQLVHLDGSLLPPLRKNGGLPVADTSALSGIIAMLLDMLLARRALRCNHSSSSRRSSSSSRNSNSSEAVGGLPGTDGPVAAAQNLASLILKVRRAVRLIEELGKGKNRSGGVDNVGKKTPKGAAKQASRKATASAARSALLEVAVEIGRESGRDEYVAGPVATLVRSLQPSHFPAVPAGLLAASLAPRTVAAALAAGGAAGGGGGGGGGGSQEEARLLDDDLLAALRDGIKEAEKGLPGASSASSSSDEDTDRELAAIEAEIRSRWIPNDLESAAVLGADAAIRSSSPVQAPTPRELSMLGSIDAALLVAEPFVSHRVALQDVWPFAGAGNRGARAAIGELLGPLAAD